MSESTGLKESLKRMAGTLLVIFQTRLELLSLEMEERAPEHRANAALWQYRAVLLWLGHLAADDIYRGVAMGQLPFAGVGQLYRVVLCRRTPGMERIAPRGQGKIKTVFRQSGRIGR